MTDYLTQDIIESQDIMEDEAKFSARAHRARRREHDQRQGLTNLGLSEVEAVEYVLMLSRDEVNGPARSETSAQTAAADISNSYDIDEGVFEGDFDCIGPEGSLDNGKIGSRTLGTFSMPTSTSFRTINSGTPPSSIAVSNSSGSISSFSSGLSSATTSPVAHLDYPIPGTPWAVGTPKFSHSSYSSGSSKVQVSPSYRAEALEAGTGWGIEEVPRTRLGLEDHHFPPIGGTGTENSSKSLTRGVINSANILTEFTSATMSPKSKRQRSSVASSSAWSTQQLSLFPSDRMMGLNMPSSSSSTGPAVLTGSTRGSVTMNHSPTRVVENQDGSEMDNDLRFVLELSLAEAQSTRKFDL